MVWLEREVLPCYRWTTPSICDLSHTSAAPTDMKNRCRDVLGNFRQGHVSARTLFCYDPDITNRSQVFVAKVQNEYVWNHRLMDKWPERNFKSMTSCEVGTPAPPPSPSLFIRFTGFSEQKLSVSVFMVRFSHRPAVRPWRTLAPTSGRSVSVHRHVFLMWRTRTFPNEIRASLVCVC